MSSVRCGYGMLSDGAGRRGDRRNWAAVATPANARIGRADVNAIRRITYNADKL